MRWQMHCLLNGKDQGFPPEKIAPGKVFRINMKQNEILVIYGKNYTTLARQLLEEAHLAR